MHAINKYLRILDNPEKPATQDTQYEEKQTHNMCLTPPHANKHKQRK